MNKEKYTLILNEVLYPLWSSVKLCFITRFPKRPVQQAHTMEKCHLFQWSIQIKIKTMALQSLEVWISELGASLAILESHLPILCVFCGFPLGEGNGTPLQQAAVHGVAKSQTRLSDFSFTFHFHALEKEMAPHSSVLAWKIPGMGVPGGLPSMGSHRVGHCWSDLAGFPLSLLSLIWRLKISPHSRVC